MNRRRSHGEGSIKRRGENIWRLRYRDKGRRFSTTFHGSLADARKELRRLLTSGDDGTHVDPTKITLGQWIEQWLAAGAPGRRKQPIGRRALARYGQLLRIHLCRRSEGGRCRSSKRPKSMCSTANSKVRPQPRNMCMLS
jgi:integrase